MVSLLFSVLPLVIQVKDQEREGPKMVPKRQIQLKKKDSDNMVKGRSEKLQVWRLPVRLSKHVCPPVCLLTCLHVQVKDGTAHSEASANEMACPVNHQRPDLLLRQHSMPASLHTHSTPSSDIDSCRVYRGLVAGAGQGIKTCAYQRVLYLSTATLTKPHLCLYRSVCNPLPVQSEACQNSPRAVCVGGSLRVSFVSK